MRLAEGQVRPLVQIVPIALMELMSDPDPDRSQGHGSDAPDDQDRHRQAEAGLRGLTGVDPNSPGMTASGN